jgi:hypothetical protein
MTLQLRHSQSNQHNTGRHNDNGAYAGISFLYTNRWLSIEQRSQGFSDTCVHHRPDLRIAQSRLCLSFKLWLRKLHNITRRKTLFINACKSTALTFTLITAVNPSLMNSPGMLPSLSLPFCVHTHYIYPNVYLIQQRTSTQTFFAN